MKKLIAITTAIFISGISFISPANAATTKCSLTQAIEEGPYYLSSTPTRSDVTDGQAGKALTLKFTVLDSKCKAIKNARVDIWYANAQGVYSGVASRGDDLGAGTNSGTSCAELNLLMHRALSLSVESTLDGIQPEQSISIRRFG